MQVRIIAELHFFTYFRLVLGHLYFNVTKVPPSLNNECQEDFWFSKWILYFKGNPVSMIEEERILWSGLCHWHSQIEEMCISGNCPSRISIWTWSVKISPTLSENTTDQRLKPSKAMILLLLQYSLLTLFFATIRPPHHVFPFLKSI